MRRGHGEGWGWASHTLRIRKHMQWSSEGLKGEWELEEGKECFLGRKGGVKGRDGNTSARPGVFPPCFYPTSPSLPPPSASSHLLTFIFEPLGWRDWCARTWRETWTEAAYWHHPLGVVIPCKYHEHFRCHSFVKTLFHLLISKDY